MLLTVMFHGWWMLEIRSSSETGRRGTGRLSDCQFYPTHCQLELNADRCSSKMVIRVCLRQWYQQTTAAPITQWILKGVCPPRQESMSRIRESKPINAYYRLVGLDRNSHDTFPARHAMARAIKRHQTNTTPTRPILPCPMPRSFQVPPRSLLAWGVGRRSSPLNLDLSSPFNRNQHPHRRLGEERSRLASDPWPFLARSPVTIFIWVKGRYSSANLCSTPRANLHSRSWQMTVTLTSSFPRRVPTRGASKWRRA